MTEDASADGGVDVPAAVETVVEDTELPRRLKDDVYGVVQERDATADEAADIASAVESRYLATRVDPLDPVGTVSAQSLGEPGTQMSIPGGVDIIVREGGETRSVSIGTLVDEIFTETSVRELGEHEVALAPEGLEALSLGRDERTRWKRVQEVSRHRSPDELLRLELASGRSITATANHSFVVRENGDIVPIAGDELAMGDRLPVVPDDQSPVAATRRLTDGGTAIRTNQDSDQQSCGTVQWEQITAIEHCDPPTEYVYDLSVAGLETFTTAQGVVTHNTMNTFHYAGVAEFDVTQGLPRLIELVDARKTPDTPTMWVYLEDEYAQERERAHEVVWNIEATRILALGDISTNVADMNVRIDLNEDTLAERWPTVDDTAEVVAEIAETIEGSLDVETTVEGSVITFGPDRPSYRELLQLVERLRDIVFKGLEEINRVVIKKEDVDGDEEFVLITEGSAYSDVLEIEGVDATRSTCNNIHEIFDTLGVEAAREAIINETMDTLEEQGLDDVNVRHLMLVADIMTNTGEIESIGRHGISGSKESVLARAAFEVTVSHLLDAATFGEIDDLNGVTENVIVGKPIKLGTGDVNLRMGAKLSDGESADD